MVNTIAVAISGSVVDVSTSMIATFFDMIALIPYACVAFIYIHSVVIDTAVVAVVMLLLLLLLVLILWVDHCSWMEYEPYIKKESIFPHGKIMSVEEQ